MSVSDEVLAARAQKGNLAAEEDLMRKYKETVRLKSRMFYIEGADEEDVIQEGMIGLFKAIHQYSADRDSSFGTFAGVCITRQIIDAIRAAGRKKHTILNNSVSLSNPVGSSSDSLTIEDTLRDDSAIGPEDMFVIKDLVYCMIHNGDNIFSEYEMKVLNKLMKGREIRDIAEMTGKSSKSVDNAVRRIKKKIAEYISA